MELDKCRPIIISAGIGGWYAKGIERLERSLNFVGWAGEVKTWKNEYPPNSYYHEDVPYYFKIAAFEWARKNNYTHVLWLDASFWAVKNPMPVFDLICDQGYYAFRSGYNLAQSVNDNALEEAVLTRDEAELVNEYASGCVGFDFTQQKGLNLYHLWKIYMDRGMSKGSRNHDNQSTDERFLFHRQDQSCLSLAMHEFNLTSQRDMDFVSYFGTGYNESKLIFFIQGL